MERLLDVEAGPDAVLAPGLERVAEHVVFELVSIHREPDRDAVMCSIPELNREGLRTEGAGRDMGGGVEYRCCCIELTHRDPSMD